MTDSCLFCKIVRGEIPATIVKQTDTALVFRDINPQAPTHLLVIPRRHVASLATATDAQELGELLLLAAEVARETGIEERGYRTVINTGRDGQQTVQHVHVHLLGGRQLTWPPG